MNKHRFHRKSKKMQGRGFFSDAAEPALTFLRDQLNKADALPDKAKTFVHDKLNEIFSKKKKHGAGLKFLKI